MQAYKEPIPTAPKVSKSSLFNGSPNFSLFPSEIITIGFEQASYMAQEGTPVQVCAVVLEGSVERNVTFTFGAQPGTAGEGITGAYQVHLFVAIPL